MTKRILAMLMATVLILNALPWTVFAEELSENTAPSSQAEITLPPKEESSVPEKASVVTSNRFNWSLDGTVLTISGKGPMDDYTAEEAAPWGTSVTKVIIQPGITTIGARAFYYCQQLTEISIPDTVAHIGQLAFCHCIRLEEISLPEGLRTISSKAFLNCSGFGQLVVPDSVETIGLGAFSGCTSLTSITIPFVGASRKTATDNYQYPFGYIFGTASYTDGVGYSQSYWGSETITSTKYYIPSSLRAVVVTGGQILEGAFGKCAKLTQITLPQGITEIGASAFADCTALNKISIPEGVTLIGSGAFKNCKALKKPELPDSLVRIGSDAFSGCNSLQYTTAYSNNATLSYFGSTKNPYMVLAGARNVGTTVQIHQNTKIIGEEAMDALSSLQTLTLPDGVVSIGDWAFAECTALTSISLGSSLQFIGRNAFYYCPNLQSVTIPDSVDCIDYGAFQSCTSLAEIIIPEGVTQLRERAFMNCTSLNKVSVPNSLTHLDTYVFYGCTGLTGQYLGNAANPKLILHSVSNTSTTKFTFDANTKFIDSYAFQGCTKLTELTLPEGILTIAGGAFAGCSGLQSVTIPNSVTMIGSGTFTGCGSLRSLTLPFVSGRLGLLFSTASYTGGTPVIQKTPSGNSSTYYIPETLNSVHITGSALEKLPYGALSCLDLEYITLPEGLTDIGDYALSYNGNLDSIKIPDGVKQIGAYAFSGCTRLYNPTIPDSVETIGAYAFNACSNITSLSIPDSVQTIGESALAGCSGLQTLAIPFVGESRKTVKSTNLYPFGYLFGTASYTGGTATVQEYRLTVGGGVQTATYYLPTTLQTVTVSDGIIPHGTFSKCANLTTVTLENVTGEISAYAFDGCSKLTSVTLPEGVTAIMEYAFRDCTKLRNLSLPDSLAEVRSTAFLNCTALPYVTYNGGKYLGNSENPYVLLAGVADTAITTFSIPNGTKVIGPSAFSGCSKLTGVTLPAGAVSIGAEAFEGCSKLTAIHIPSSITAVGSNAFFGCSGLTRVDISDLGAWCNIRFASTAANPLSYGKKLYLDSTLLTHADIPKSVTQINDYAFYGCSGLTSVTIPDSVTVINRYAFQNCTGLTHVTVPDSVRTIGTAIFAGCSKLQSVTVPFIGDSRKTTIDTKQYPLGYLFGGTSYTGGTATSQYHKASTSPSYTTYYIPTTLRSVTVTGGNILLGAFYNCSNLTSVVLSGNVGGIGSYAFYNCKNLTQLNIPAGATSIGTEAFKGCSKLTEMVIPDTVATIDSYAFEDCTALRKLIIGSGVKTIGIYACSDCSSLSELTIGNNVQSIGTYAFSDCTSLTDVVVPNSVTTIENSVFVGCSNLQSITIPFVGKTRKTATDTYQYPFGYIFGESATGSTAAKQSYYGSSTTTTTTSTYYIPSKLTTVTVTDGDLLYGAFSNCTNLTAIYLGEGVLHVNPDAFMGTNNLEAIEAAKNNPNYSSLYRILYNKDLTEIIWKPSNHRFHLTVNYTYANGDQVFDTVLQKHKEGATYSVGVPELLGYSSRYDTVSGTMPAQDLTVDVIYYENDLLNKGSCTDTLSWTMYDDGALVFRGTGEMPDYTTGNAPWAEHADKVLSVYIDPRVTSIGAYAFENCRNLTFVDYGYSVAAIGEYAFAGCSGLTAFKLPESVTTISAGAFFRCTGLKNVVIPDNITAVAEDAFLGCTQLVQVTVGGAVTQIGSNAFADCPALTQLYFRGNPASLGSNAFGSTGGKFVYYYGSVALWDEAVEDGKWNGYTAVPYNAIAREDFTGTNVYIIKVVDRYNNPLVNAVVDLGGEIQSTNADGMAYYVKPTEAQTLTVSCSDHITFEDAAFIATDKQVMDIIELSDRPSTVQGVSFRGKSIATSVEILNCAETGSVKIAVRGYSKYTITKYELHQGDRLLATEKTASNNCTFTVKATAFEEGQTVLVRMYTADGNMVASALNIDVIKLASVSENQIIGELNNIDLNVGVGELGDLNFKLPFDGKGDEKLYTMVQGRTIRIGVNLDIKELFEKKETPLSVIQKKIDKAVENFSVVDADVSFNICGYIEIEYLGGGEYYLKTSYVKMSVGVNVSAQAQASLIGIVGVHFKVSLSAEGTLELLITRFSPESGFQLADLNLTLDVGVGVEGGAFLFWGAGSASVYGDLHMGFTLGIVPNLEVRQVYVTGELGAKWSLLWGLKKGKYVIAEGDIYRWPEDAQALAKRFREARNDPDSYENNDRAYLENRTQWQPGGDYLQKSVYDNIAPEIVTCGDSTMMVWLDDNAQRADNDFQTLYYSVYTDSGWSAPMAVDDNGTFDCEFDVYADGSRIYVIYTEMGAPSGAEMPDISDEGSVTAFVDGVEVKVVVYENGSFTQPTQLTNNTVCELLPHIDLVGGKLTATWLESNAVGLNPNSASTAVRTATLEDGSWCQPQTVAQGQNTVSDLTTLSLNGEIYTAYIVDADGDSQTQEDQALILRGESTLQLDVGRIADVDRATVAGCSVLTWSKDGKLYMLSGVAQAPVCLTPETVASASKFQILPLSEEQSLLLFVADNYDASGNAVNGTDIYSVYIGKDGCQTDAVRMTRTEGYVSNYSIAYRGEQLVTVFTETFATVESDDVQTVTHLRSIALNFYTDLILDSVDYDVTGAMPNTEFPITLHLRNGGTNAIDGITASLYDSAGALVYTAEQSVSLPSGGAAECALSLILPQAIDTADYRLVLSSRQGTLLATDAHPEDNSAALSLAYADLQVDAEQKIIGEKNYIILNVSNSGNAGSSALLQIYAPNKSGRLLSELATDVITPGSAQQYLVDMGALVTNADSMVTCIAEPNFPDPFTLNNTDTVALLHVQEDTFVTDPEQIIHNPELSVSTAEFDKFAPANISLQITAEAESFSCIENLTENTHYTVDQKGNLTVYSSYLSTLAIGNHALRFVFDFGYDKPVVRVLTITVTDSTPIPLTGSIAISGAPVVGSTVFADISSLTPRDAALSYLWTIGDAVVSTENTYAIEADDNGKVLVLTVTAGTGYTGVFRAEVMVSLPQATAPSAPVVATVGSDFIAVVKASGMEYSLDCALWQQSERFTGLSPNQTYTVYARVAATELSLASQPSAGVRVTTLKNTVAAPAVPVAAEITHTQIILVADPAMEYRLEGGQWTDSPVFSGLQPETDYVFCQRYKETDIAYASPESKSTLATARFVTLSGTVTGYPHNPEPFTVTLMQNGNVLSRVVTNDGSYRFTGLVGGSYTLFVTKIGHLPAELSVTLETADLQQDVQLTPADYTVTFLNENGTQLSRQTYRWGDPVTAPADPQKAADHTYTYTFAGWDQAVTACAGDATYTATYTAAYIDYTVAFLDWDGQVLSSSTYHYGDSITAPADPQKAADHTYTYTFAGWDQAVTACAGDATYTATYTAAYIDYTVAFLDWDGQVLSSSTYHYGDSITAPADPQKPADDTCSYAFSGWDKEIAPCTGDATYTATYVIDKFFTVTVTVGDAVSRFFTLTEALAAATEGCTVQLLSNSGDSVEISTGLTLDLNGFDLTGNLTVTDGVTVSLKDSQTDDYTVEDAYGYGKLTGTVTGVQGATGYVMLTETDGISFHKVDLQLTHMTLRATEAGVYYKINFAGDEVVARNVARYGVAFSVTGIPTAENMGICSWFDSFAPGKDSNAANGTLLHGILKETNSQSENAANAELPIYGRAYLQLQDGSYILGDWAERSFRRQVELADAQWSDLSSQQQAALLSLYQKYQALMEGWNLPNLQVQ